MGKLIWTMFLSLSGLINLSDDHNVDASPDRRLKNIFYDWQKSEIKSGRFLSAKNCNSNWLETHPVTQNVNDREGLVFGFPIDSAEYEFSFADLNGDDKLDGLVCFTPVQCDGGNVSMWVQWQVFLISDKSKFVVTDKLEVDKFSSTDFDKLGFYQLDSIGTNRIYGCYHEFADDDGRCCPSINKLVVFSFTDRKLISIRDNVDRN